MDFLAPSPLGIIKIVEEMSRLHERFLSARRFEHSFKAVEMDAYNTPANGSSTWPRLKVGSFHWNATRIGFYSTIKS